MTSDICIDPTLSQVWPKQINLCDIFSTFESFSWTVSETDQMFHEQTTHLLKRNLKCCFVYSRICFLLLLGSPVGPKVALFTFKNTPESLIFYNTANIWQNDLSRRWFYSIFRKLSLFSFIRKTKAPYTARI